MTDSAAVLALVCEALTSGEREQAAAVLAERYPFEPVGKARRRYSERQMTDLFVRDGFVDRYRGTRLVFPPRSGSSPTRSPSASPTTRTGR